VRLSLVYERQLDVTWRDFYCYSLLSNQIKSDQI